MGDACLTYAGGNGRAITFHIPFSVLCDKKDHNFTCIATLDTSENNLKTLGEWMIGVCVKEMKTADISQAASVISIRFYKQWPRYVHLNQYTKPNSLSVCLGMIKMDIYGKFLELKLLFIKSRAMNAPGVCARFNETMNRIFYDVIREFDSTVIDEKCKPNER